MPTPCQVINATIYYSNTSTSVASLDPITGMPVFTASPEQTLEVSIEEEETEPKFMSIEGAVDEQEVRVGGRCVNPAQMPKEIKPGNKYRIKWRYSTNQEFEGTIHILPAMASRFECLDSYFGDRIFGVLVTAKNNRL